VNSAQLLLETLRFHGGPPIEHLVHAWGNVEGRALRRLVAFEGCAMWLYRRLRQLGVLDRVDPELSEWVSAKAREGTARNLLIDAEAESLAGTFRDLGTPAVFLKGVARRLSVDRYPLADARVTNDVDVLVPADQAWATWRALCRMEYERTTRTGPPRPQHHHLPALWTWRRVAVEIHTTHARVVAPAESWRRHYVAGIDVDRGGIRYRVPPATEMFWSGTAHGLSHPEIAFLLVLFFDAAVIWASGAAVDWSEIVHRLDAKEIVDGAAAAAWLGAAAQVAGVEPPPALAGRMARYDLERELAARLAVLRRFQLSGGLRKALAWWTSESARALA
jgi:putative nucleotidyltransferase-like protein